MRGVIVFILIAIILAGSMLFSNDGGSALVSTEIKLESIRGDITELTGKGLYFKNRVGTYPIFSENVYLMEESKVISSLKTFERFLAQNMEVDSSVTDKEAHIKDYISEYFKLANIDLLKNEGISQGVANKELAYFYDTKTGKVWVSDLIENGDDDYMKEILPDSGYKVIGSIIIEETDNPSNKMNPVHGSLRSGTSMYFYGGGSMKLARRDELIGRIVDISDKVGISGDYEILYIQPSTLKAVIQQGSEVFIIELKL